MEKKDREERYLEAIRALKPELRDLLGPEEGAQLNRRLGQYLRRARSPEECERAVTRALDALREHPPARERLADILRAAGEDDLRLLYEPLPGPGGLLPAGAVVVCPVDPSHCRRRRQYKGQRLFCPEHGVELVPEEEVRRD